MLVRRRGAPPSNPRYGWLQGTLDDPYKAPMPLPAPTRRQLLLITLVAVAIHALTIAHRRLTHAGDFDISRELGRRFLAGEYLYAGGLHYPYMPAAAMIFAPLALVPPWVGFALRYAASLAALALTLRWLSQTTGGGGNVVRVIALTVLLASHYIVRDLDDAGPHLLLLALVIAGAACSARGRRALAAMAFGLAIAIKAPHAILLLFFAWQRRWRLLGCTVLAAAAWIALPSIWMGPSQWWSHQMEWTTTVAASVRGTPLPGPRDSEERLQNQALAPTVIRVARRWNAGEQSRALAAVAAAVMLAWLLWSLRRSMRAVADVDLHALSAFLIAMPLLAPLAWIQHLVVVIPALMLILTRTTALSSRNGVALALFGFLTLVLNREFLGRTLYIDLLTYGLHTVALLLLLATLAATNGRTTTSARGRRCSDADAQRAELA